MILHICSRDEWASAEQRAEHRPASLVTEGFVHCSDPGTVHLPARRFYAGRADLLLLEIDEERLGVPLRWEPGVPVVDGGPWFPHVYGPIRLGAVRATHDFPPTADGGFQLPVALAHR